MRGCHVSVALRFVPTEHFGKIQGPAGPLPAPRAHRFCGALWQPWQSVLVLSILGFWLGGREQSVLCGDLALLRPFVPEEPEYLIIFDFTMNEAPTGSGSIPLQEYRKDIPPGWCPGDATYPLRAYFDRLRLWYRICNLAEEAIGPTIAGRLYGRAHRVAMSLRVVRPDGQFDTGDAALVRLEVDEVRDPQSGMIIQNHIPSGVQHLTTALRAAFGQQDQDLATQSLERFFNLARGRLTLQEFSVEFDARFDEASDRAGLAINEVARFFLFFQKSGLTTKQIDDIKLQVGGDFTRFADARALALRLSSNKPEADIESYYQDYDYGDEDGQSYWQDDGTWSGHEDTWWSGYEMQDYEEDGDWVLEYDDTMDAYYQQYMDEEWWNQQTYEEEQTYDNKPEGPTDTSATSPDVKTGEQTNEEYYGGYGKGKGYGDGCFVCGSKWHRARDCPMAGSNKGHGKGKGKPPSKDSYMGNQNAVHYGKGKGKGKVWRWRPRKGKGKYGKGKGKGFGKYGGGKSYGKRHWFTAESSPKKTVRPGLKIDEGIPDASTRLHAMTFSTTTPRPEIHRISTPPMEEGPKLTRSFTAVGNTETSEEQKPVVAQADKKHVTAFSFAFNNYYQTAEYFSVRGEKRRGLIIDPGAASGLIGCDTLKDIIENCITPFGKDKDILIDKQIASPVSGINGGSNRTLGQVTIPLVTGGCPISFTGEVIGGDGSLCPALIGNPSLRKMNSTIFTNYFQNGDGLLVLDSRNSDSGSMKMLRILLTDSGHYILPTDHSNTAKVSQETQREVAVFWNKVAEESHHQWDDINPRMLHVFATTTQAASDAEGDRSEPMTAEAPSSVTLLPEQEHGDQLHPGKVREDPKDESTIPEQTEKMTDGMTDNENCGDGTLPTAEAPPTGTPPHDIKHDVFPCENNSTDEQPCVLTSSILSPTDENYQFHNEEDFPPYQGDMLPEGPDKSRLTKKYKAMPEEYYSLDQMLNALIRGSSFEPCCRRIF